MAGPGSHIPTVPPQTNTPPFANQMTGPDGAGGSGLRRPPLLRFQAVTYPAAAQGNPSIDGTGVRMIVPTARARSRLSCTMARTLVAGRIPNRVLSASVHLVDLTSNAAWANAVLSVRVRTRRMRCF